MGIFLGDKPVSVYFNGAAAGLPVQGVFLGPIQVFPTGTAATVPDAPTIDVARYEDIDGDTRVNGSVLNNGANVTSLRFVFSVSGARTPDELVIFDENGVDEFGAVFEADYSGETVQVFATNSVGESEGSTPVEVIAV
jgi:hypothetical protein